MFLYRECDGFLFLTDNHSRVRWCRLFYVESDIRTVDLVHTSGCWWTSVGTGLFNIFIATAQEICSILYFFVNPFMNITGWLTEFLISSNRLRLIWFLFEISEKELYLWCSGTNKMLFAGCNDRPNASVTQKSKVARHRDERSWSSAGTGGGDRWWHHTSGTNSLDPGSHPVTASG